MEEGIPASSSPQPQEPASCQQPQERVVFYKLADGIWIAKRFNMLDREPVFPVGMPAFVRNALNILLNWVSGGFHLVNRTHQPDAATAA